MAKTLEEISPACWHAFIAILALYMLNMAGLALYGRTKKGEARAEGGTEAEVHHHFLGGSSFNWLVVFLNSAWRSPHLVPLTLPDFPTPLSSHFHQCARCTSAAL